MAPRAPSGSTRSTTPPASAWSTTDDDGRVREFIEKPPADAAPTNLINAGTYVFEPSFLERVPLGERVSIERVTFPAMAAEGRLFAMAEPSYWLDTGTPDGLPAGQLRPA